MGLRRASHREPDRVIVASDQLSLLCLHTGGVGADRWRNTTDLPLQHINGPDQYIDPEALQFIQEQFKLGEPLCRLDKGGKLSGEGGEWNEGS